MNVGDNTSERPASSNGNAANELRTVPAFEVLVKDSPYAVVPELNPNSSLAQVRICMQQVQKRSEMTREHNQAFKVLRNPPHRAVWDLLSLGTTPGVTQEEWRRLKYALGDHCESDVYAQWIKRVRRRPPDFNALHVCALLALHRAERGMETEGAADEAALRDFTAFWTSLSFRHDWLRQFLEYRIRVWAWRKSPEELKLFLERASKRPSEVLKRLAGNAPQRRSLVLGWWERELTSIKAMYKAGVGEKWTAWTAGFGPLGLEVLGERGETRRWLLNAGRSYRGGSPLAALCDGNAMLTAADPRPLSEAATAVLWLCSELGPAAAEVWNGRGRSARWRLGEASSPVPVGEGSDDEFSWFGEGEAAQLRRARAKEELLAEALVAQFVEDLGRSDVDVQDVLSVARRVLAMAVSHRNPRVLIERLEAVMCGRLLDCLEPGDKCLSKDTTRALAVGDSLLEALNERGMGKRLSQHMAVVCRARAVRRWNTACDLGFRVPNASVQAKCLRDSLKAMDLMPQEPKILEAVVKLLEIETHLSSAERRPLLERALRHSEELAATSTGPERQTADDLRRQLLQEYDPAAARRETQEEIAQVLRKKR